MILYHGSYVEIKIPDTAHSRTKVDFGRGFYLTPIYAQAEKWCDKFSRSGSNGVISVYEFEEKKLCGLNVKQFDIYSEEWLDFIMQCRNDKDTTNYDIVIGGVANDKVFNTIELFFDGLIDKTEAIKRLRYEQPNLQVCFRTERALNELKFIESIKV